MQFTPEDDESAHREEDIEFDEQSIEHTDSRSSGRTRFNPDEGESKMFSSELENWTGGLQDRWNQIRGLNDGVGETDRRESNRQSERVDDIEFVGEECGLSQREIETAKRLISKIDCRFGPRITSEDIVLGMIVYSSHSQQKVLQHERLDDFVTDWDSDVDTIEYLIPKIDEKVKNTVNSS